MGLIHSSNFNFPPQNIEIHDKITGETVEWILESGRFIFFKKEVSHPCKSVSNYGHKPQQVILSRINCVNQDNKKQRCSDKMQ